MPISERTKDNVATADVPTTTKDMRNLMMWEHGETIRGTFAKQSKGPNKYIDDINKGWGKERTYQDIYINTFKPIGPQLEEFRK